MNTKVRGGIRRRGWTIIQGTESKMLILTYSGPYNTHLQGTSRTPPGSYLLLGAYSFVVMFVENKTTFATTGLDDGRLQTSLFFFVGEIFLGDNVT